MTSMPASRSARATTLAPRSWPSRPGLAMRTRARGITSVLIAGLSHHSGIHRRAQLVGGSRLGAGEHLVDLHQHPVGTGWVNEADQADCSRVRLALNELSAARRQRPHLRRYVVDLETDVVQPLAAPLQKTGDGVVGTERGD